MTKAKKRKKPGPKTKSPEDRAKPFGFSCPAGHYEWLAEYAAKKGLSVSAVITKMIEEKQRQVGEIDRLKAKVS